MKQFDEDEFFADLTDSVVDSDKLKYLSDLIKDRNALEKEAIELETASKELRKKILHIDQVEIPDTMDAAGVADFTTKEGQKVSVKPFVSAIPANMKEKAFDWFDDNGLGSIIKRTVSLKFDKSQSETAALAEQKLKEMGFDPDTKLDIAYQTFQATVKELHENGVMPPLHEWGVYFGRKAKISNS